MIEYDRVIGYLAHSVVSGFLSASANGPFGSVTHSGLRRATWSVQHEEVVTLCIKTSIVVPRGYGCSCYSYQCYNGCYSYQCTYSVRMVAIATSVPTVYGWLL